jgi:NAD/NADP transhydrogenase beta subunit
MGMSARCVGDEGPVPTLQSAALSAGSLGLGAAAGHIVAKRMAITDLPQMVAAFHSLVSSCHPALEEHAAVDCNKAQPKHETI